tara:strand:+ start:230 stop:499 length:270 start_codon:yes stop_codon:yes gene_type:complete
MKVILFTIINNLVILLIIYFIFLINKLILILILLPNIIYKILMIKIFEDFKERIEDKEIKKIWDQHTGIKKKFFDFFYKELLERNKVDS